MFSCVQFWCKHQSLVVPDALTVWTLNAITQLLLQKRFTDSSLFLMSTISASKRVVRHIVHGRVVLVFYYKSQKRKKERMLSQPWQSLTTLFLFSYLFVLGQTLCVAQSFAAAVHLQHERLVVAVGAAVGTAGHGQVVYCTETVEAGVTAELVDGTGQDHLMFALQDGWQKKSVLFQKWTLQLQGQRAKGLCVLYNVIHRTILQIWECGSH